MSIQIQKISDLEQLDLSSDVITAYTIVSANYGSTAEPPINYKVDIQKSYTYTTTHVARLYNCASDLRNSYNNLNTYTTTYIGELRNCTYSLETSYNNLNAYTTTYIGELRNCAYSLENSYTSLNTYTTSNIGTLYNCTYTLSEYINTIDNKYHNLCSYAYTYIGKLCDTVNTIITCDIVDLKNCTMALQNSYNILNTYTTTHVSRLYSCASDLRSSYNNLNTYTTTYIGELKTDTTTIANNVINLTSKHNTLCSYTYTHIGELCTTIQNIDAVKESELYAYKDPNSTTYITGIKSINVDGGSLVQNTYIDNYLYYNTSYHTLSIGCNYAIIHNANNNTRHNLVVGNGNGILTCNDTQRVSYSLVNGLNNVAKRTQSSVIHGVENNACDIIASFIGGAHNKSYWHNRVFIGGSYNDSYGSGCSTILGNCNSTNFGKNSLIQGHHNWAFCSNNIIMLGYGNGADEIHNGTYSTTILGNYGYVDSSTNDNPKHKNILVVGDGYYDTGTSESHYHNAIQLYTNSQHQSYLEVYSPILLDAYGVDSQGAFIGKLRSCNIIDTNNAIVSANAYKIDPGHVGFDKSIYISYAMFNRYTCGGTTYICANTINLNNALYGIAKVIEKIN